MSILGKDIDGRPIRAGDRAVIARRPIRLPQYEGLEVVVLGPAAAPSDVERVTISILSPERFTHPFLACLSNGLRLLPRTPETVSWEAMKDVWIPEGVTA